MSSARTRSSPRASSRSRRSTIPRRTSSRRRFKQERRRPSGRRREDPIPVRSGDRDAAANALGAGLLARAGVGVQRAPLDGLVDQRHELAVLGGDLIVVACGHGGLETPEVRLDLRRVVAVLEALALGALIALDL